MTSAGLPCTQPSHDVTPFYFLRLILSGVHYRLVLIFRVYLVLPAFAAYQTSVLT